MFRSILSLSLLVNVCLSLPTCPTTTAAYDYVVVGAGAGGGPVAARLAEAGYSVLVVDAGHDPNDVNTTIPLYFGRAVDDVQLELNYTVNEYPTGFTYQRNNVWYPRARGLGGSTIHNDLINVVAGTQDDFNNLASLTGDQTWSRTNMQNYFKKIEKNLYLTPSQAPDHGFSGWLKTSLNPDPTAFNASFRDDQLTAAVAALNASGPLIPDLNSLAGENVVGITPPSYTIDENHNRSSVRERLLAVQQSSAGKLQFQFDTLVTKILLCNSTAGRTTAYGIQIAPGLALPVAGNFNGKVAITNANTKNITVRHEVIVSAGTFQSPQLLMLSGIGQSQQLSQFGISPAVNLPGVGNNLQDHDEVGIMWQMKQNFTLYNGCTFLSDPKKDPCLQTWITSNHQNLYSFGPALKVATSKSPSSTAAQPDILTYFTSSFFHGFFAGFAQVLAENHNTFSAVVLKTHPSSRGTVKLTGSHPQDLVDIEKQHFQAARGPQDVADLREALKRTRSIMATSSMASWVAAEIFPGPQASTDALLDAHVYQNVFGHHACCTNPIGADNDTSAVLFGNFSVRGVANLRVVDASSWPTVPGYFVTTPIYMMSEKAADVILATAKGS